MQQSRRGWFTGGQVAAASRNEAAALLTGQAISMLATPGNI
jgi:hypothetical protein